MSNYIYYNYMYEQNAVTYYTGVDKAKVCGIFVLQQDSEVFVITLSDFS